MFLEYAVWGAWAPVLAARLLGPLKMSGKQTGWIYATLPLASMFSPLVAGQLADKYFDARWVLAVAHIVGALLLYVAIRQKTFGRLFVVMLLYSMCYAATIPLVNALMFRHLPDAKLSPKIFIWAPVAWALIGYCLTGWRSFRKSEGDGSDCLLLASVLSVLMAVVCLLQPATPPQPAEGTTPIVQALAMLKDLPFAIFIGVSLLVSGTMQFYFLGTARFMQDVRISGKYVPAAMGIAQAAQALATLFLLELFMDKLGFQWTLAIGAASWLTLYVVYALTKARWLIAMVQVLHGLAYVFFIIVGQIYVDSVASAVPAAIRSSAQALIILVTMGISLFLGTQLAGITMDKFSADGRFQWRKIWTVPLAITLAGVLVLATAFHPPAAEKAHASSPAQAGAAQKA
jgi:nucleoside transporter